MHIFTKSLRRGRVEFKMKCSKTGNREKYWTSLGKSQNLGMLWGLRLPFPSPRLHYFPISVLFDQNPMFEASSGEQRYKNGSISLATAGCYKLIIVGKKYVVKELLY